MTRAVVVVNQLAAMEPPPLGGGGEEEWASPSSSPPPTSWCHALSGLCAPDVLPRLLVPPPPSSTPYDYNDECAELRGRCACAVGNLAGDSEHNREALLSSLPSSLLEDAALA